MAFDRQAAKNAGYSDAEIDSYVNQGKKTPNILDQVGSYLKADIAKIPQDVGKNVRNTMKVMQGTSDMLGGALKATREVATNTYQPPQVPGGNLLLPTLVGAYRGAKTGESPMMTEVPKTLGVDPNSAAGIGIGLGAEILTPDPMDALAFGKAGEKVAKKTGEVITDTGENFALRGIRATKTQLDKFETATGKQLKHFVTEEGLAGNVLENTIEKAQKVQGEFDTIAENSQIRVPVENIVQFFKDKRDAMTAGLAGITKKETAKDLDTYINDIAEYGTREGSDGTIGLEELTKLRRSVDKEIPKGSFLQWLSGGKIAPKIELRNIIQDVIQDATKDTLSASGKTLDELGTQLKGLYSLEDIAQKQSLLGKGTNLIGLVPALGAIAGGSQGDNSGERIRNALIGAGFTTVANNPKVVSAISNVLIKGGEKVTKSKAFPKLIELLLKAGKETTITKTRGITAPSGSMEPQSITQ